MGTRLEVTSSRAGHLVPVKTALFSVAPTADASALTDTVLGAATLGRAAADTIVVVDAGSRALEALRSVEDVAGVSDSVTADRTLGRAAADGVTVADSVLLVPSALARAVLLYQDGGIAPGSGDLDTWVNDGTAADHDVDSAHPTAAGAPSVESLAGLQAALVEASEGRASGEDGTLFTGPDCTLFVVLSPAAIGSGSTMFGVFGAGASTHAISAQLLSGGTIRGPVVASGGNLLPVTGNALGVDEVGVAEVVVTGFGTAGCVAEVVLNGGTPGTASGNPGSATLVESRVGAGGTGASVLVPFAAWWDEELSEADRTAVRTYLADVYGAVLA